MHLLINETGYHLTSESLYSGTRFRDTWVLPDSTARQIKSLRSSGYKKCVAPRCLRYSCCEKRLEKGMRSTNPPHPFSRDERVYTHRGKHPT